jgi:hypothetical protein
MATAARPSSTLVAADVSYVTLSTVDLLDALKASTQREVELIEAQARHEDHLGLFYRALPHVLRTESYRSLAKAAADAEVTIVTASGALKAPSFQWWNVAHAVAEFFLVVQGEISATDARSFLAGIGNVNAPSAKAVRQTVSEHADDAGACLKAVERLFSDAKKAAKAKAEDGAPEDGDGDGDGAPEDGDGAPEVPVTTDADRLAAIRAILSGLVGDGTVTEGDLLEAVAEAAGRLAPVAV